MCPGQYPLGKHDNPNIEPLLLNHMGIYMGPAKFTDELNQLENCILLSDVQKSHIKLHSWICILDSRCYVQPKGSKRVVVVMFPL